MVLHLTLNKQRTANSRLNQNSTALNALVASRELTQGAADWVTQTLDPFHDWQKLPAGFPDATSGQSFIQCVTLTKTTTINLAPQDVHVFTLPQLSTREFWQQAVEAPTYWGATTTQIPYGTLGPVNIVTCSAGKPTMPFYDPLTQIWSSVDIGGDPLFKVQSFDFSEYLVGESRLVSLGFEVHNVSPELLKSGSVVTYRSPQTLTKSQIICGPPGNTYTVQDFKNITRSVMPPPTAEAALLLSGSQQWEAYDGCYSVCTMSSKENPIYDPDYTDQIYQPTYTPGQDLLTGILLFPRNSSMFPNTITNVQPTPFNTNGAYFSGLQVGAILTVTVRAYIECFPSPDQKSYLSLTRPSVAYDPTAIELYSRAAFNMKPATKVANNAGGEHWAVVKAVLRDVAPKFSRLINPIENVVRVARRKKADPEKMSAAIAKLNSKVSNLGLADETKIFGNDLGSVISTVRQQRESIRKRRAEKAAHLKANKQEHPKRNTAAP